MSDRLVHLGRGRYVRAGRITAILPIEGDDRGPGRRTRVWVQGIPEPVVASRTEAAILRDLTEGDGLEGDVRDVVRATRRRRVGEATITDQDALF